LTPPTGILKRASLQTLGIIALGIIGAGLTHFLHPDAPSWNESALREGEISLEQALQLPSDQRIWLDARESMAFAEAHIPGAMSLNEDDWDAGFARIFETWDGSQLFIVYCDSRACQSSAQVAERLNVELPGVDVRILKGGWQTWLENQ